MQDLSFHFDNPKFAFHGFTFSILIFTYENVYGLRNSAKQQLKGKNELEVHSEGLTWAGGQESSVGNCLCCFRYDPMNGFIQVEVKARHVDKIRCVKLILHDHPRASIHNLPTVGPAVIPETGLILNYPEGWRELSSPLLVFEHDSQNQYSFVRSMDYRVREKRIAVIPHGNAMNIELIWEEDAIHQTSQVTVPPWEIGTVDKPEEIYSRQMKWAEKVFHLEPWETRKDVPEWARKISLVVAIHLQHFTGYIFNTYAQAMQTALWFSKRFPAEATLFYLPGWEGRYYWQYGDYKPDRRLGGETGFGNLIDRIHQLGAHCMPMFGMNVVNKNSLNYEQWGKPSQRVNASGNICEASVDWESSRDYDLGWGAMLNPGAPSWQNRLVEQITTLRDRFQFQSAFLDISAIWWNDPNFNVYDGTLRLINRLHEGQEDFLVGGEAWYDGMSACTPLVQCGHTDGRMNWPDEPYGPAFEKYCRAFGHLSLGDPGRRSTGVHELGTNLTWQTPLRRGIIPTVTIVDRSLEDGLQGVEAILKQAEEYQAAYL